MVTMSSRPVYCAPSAARWSGSRPRAKSVPMMLGSTNCQSASEASARVRRSSSFNSKTVESSKRWPLKWRILWCPEQAAPGHRAEERFEGFRELVRIVEGNLGHVGEKVLRQQPGVFGEKAEHQAIEEAGNAQVLALDDGDFGARPGVGQFRAFALLQGAGYLGELLRQRLGDFERRALGLEEVGILKQRAEQPQVLRAVDLLIGEFVRLLNRAVEVGADDVAVKIADDEQRRIQERFTVAQQLAVGFVEVLLLALVFPGEATLFPNVGKAAFARLCFFAGLRQFKQFGILDDALLEAEEIAAAGVGLGGCGLTEQAAKVVEMLRVARGFLALEAVPLLFEFGGCHARPNRCLCL